MALHDARQWRHHASIRQDRARLWPAIAAGALLSLGFSNRGEAPRSSSSPTRVGATSRNGRRGRVATKPSEIPIRGWKDIVLRVRSNVSEHRIVAIAAGVTFYSILAIFPAIAALVSLYGLFADTGTIAIQLEQASGILPGGAIEVIRDQVTRVASQRESALGLTFATGLVVALWSANAGMKALFDALNIVYSEDEKRGFVRLNAISLGFTAAAILLALLAIGAVVVLPVVLTFIGLAAASETLVQIIRWPALFIVFMLALAAVYRYGPSREQPRWRWVTWGSALAALVWLAASVLFSWYAANFGSYNETYGSLGAVIAFMVWIWLSAIVILLGGELDAEMEHQTARDTTTGRPKPMGRREATMADSLGAAQKS